MSKTQNHSERNTHARGELTDAELDTVAGGFFSDIIRRAIAIEEAKNHPMIQILKDNLK